MTQDDFFIPRGTDISPAAILPGADLSDADLRDADR